SGLSLLEVLVALAIFFVSYVAIWQLMNVAGDRAEEVAQRNQATQLAQSKLNEMIAGVEPMESISETEFEDAPRYFYDVTVSDGPVASLRTVQTTVKHKDKNGNETLVVKLTQIVLDPASAGSTQDVVGATDTTGSTDTTNMSGSGTTPNSGTTTPNSG